MKIAFVDYVLEPDKPGRSGLSDIVWDMATELTNQGHEVHIIASYHSNVYPDPRVVIHNFPTPPIGYRNIIGQLWILKRAASIAKTLQIDIIHTPEYVSTAVLSTLGIKTPLVLTVPGNIFQRLQDSHGYDWSYVQVLKWAARTSARKCARVLAISNEMKRWWEWTGSAPEHTITIPCGIDMQRFAPVPNARAKLDIPMDPLLLLYVGRFSQEKGLLDLLAAMRELDAPRPVRLVMIGKGALQQELEAQIASDSLNDRVEIRSWVDPAELPLWYSAADALVMPSWNEPLGRVMLEAMACATPVIASTTEGPLDHIQPGVNGFLFKTRDTNALRHVLQQVVADPASLQNMRHSALGYIQNYLSWTLITRRIVTEIYTPILDQQYGNPTTRNGKHTTA